MEKRTLRLYCNAPTHHRRGAPPLGDVPAAPVTFAESSARLPDEPDGRLWLRCPSKDCRAWNGFDVVRDDRNDG